MKNILFVTGVHGNEPIPVFALAGNKLSQIIANPKALSLGKRFLDRDLNSSFGVRGNGYEIKRAKEILNLIPKNCHIIDFHTFSAVSEPFVVIVDKKMIKLALQTGIKHIVLMEHNIKKGNALINHRDGISVEVGGHEDYKSFLTTMKVINNIKERQMKIKEVNLYSVFGVIKKPGKYINFKKHQDGFIPVLAGEKAYDFYGLKAKKIKL
ncbi:MAG: M14 family metallopeptidase [Patescibacteria group bacterium]